MIWFVVFHPKRREHWWARRFGHVSLAGFKDDTWVHIDLGRESVVVRPVHRYDDVQDFLSLLCENAVVVKVGAAPGKGGSFTRPLTCVSFVKHTLGVRSRALRPDGLYASLIRNYNAEVINEGAIGKSPGRNPGTETTATAS